MSEYKHTALSMALRKADYDTPYLFDLLVEAADLIDQQHETLKDLADRFEGNIYSNLSAKRARDLIAKVSGENS